MDFGREMYQQFTIGYYLNVSEPEVQSVITVYPNPSAGLFHFDIASSNAQDVTITVTDVLGRRIYSEALQNIFSKSFDLNLSEQPDGIYFAVVQSGNKRMVRKLVKSK